MGVLNQKEFNSLVADGTSADVQHIPDFNGQMIAGYYSTTAPSLADGQSVLLRTTAEGKLMVDTELSVSTASFTIDNIKVFSLDGTVANVKYAKVDSSNRAMIDINEQTLTAVKVSSTSTPNLVTNPIFTEITDGTTGVDVIPVINSIKSDFSSISGTVTSVDSGTSDVGTQRVTISTDDIVQVSSNTSANLVTNPLFAKLTDGTTGVGVTASGKLMVDAEVTLVDYTDNSNEFTVDSSKGLSLMGLATSNTVASGNIGAIRITTNRNMGVDISEQSLTAIKVSSTSTPNLVTNPIFSEITDGTTGVVVETAGTKKALNVNVTDGTNDMPTMDAAGRQGFVQIADGTNVVPVLAGTVKTLPSSIHDGTTMAEVLSGTHDALKTAITDGTSVVDVVVQDAAFGTAAKGFAVFGKYQATPTTYTDNDAAPILLDANGRIVLSSDIEIGGVELKDGTTDNRAEIKAPNTAAMGMGLNVAPAVYNATPPTVTDTFTIPLQTDVNGNLKVNSTVNIPTTLTGGEKTNSGTGAPEALGSSLVTKSIYVRAKSANTSFVCVGDSLVHSGTSQQVRLDSNDSVTLDISNRATVYLAVNVAGEGVDYLTMS